MQKTKKRFLSVLLACAMIIGLFPFAAFAAGEENTATSTTITIDSQEDLANAIEGQQDGQTWVLAPGEYDVTTISNNSGKYGSSMIITANNITIKAADPENKPVLYGFSNEFNAGVDQFGKNGQDTIYISGKNVTLENLKIMPLGGIGAGANNWQKTVEVTSTATGFTMTGCETLPNNKQHNGEDNSMKKAAGNIHVSINDAKITGNSFGTGTTISAGWVNGVSAADTYTVDVSDNYWGENVTAADIAGKIDGNVKVDTYYTDADMEEETTIGGIPVATADQLQAAVTSAKDGDTIILGGDVVLDGTGKGNTEGLLTIQGKNITLDGNGYTISAEKVSSTPSMINIQYGANVTVKNLTIKNLAGAITRHGLNVISATATVNDVIVENGSGYAIVVNGSAVTVDGLTTENNKWGGINVDNTTGDASLVVNNAAIQEYNSIRFEKSDADGNEPSGTINGGSFQYVTIGDNVDLNMVVNGGTFATGTPDGTVNIKDYVAPGMEYDPSTGKVKEIYSGKYSYAINVANMDNGSVSVDKYATEGEKVTLAVSPDKAYKLDELTVTAGGKEVEVTDNGDGTYTFTMPSGNVKVSVTFVEDEDYVEPDNSISISMTIGSNDFVINNNIVTVPDAAPYIANDRTYVPFRALGEALGATVEWDNDARTVTYTLGDTTIVMTIGDTTYTINGVEKSMDVAPEITGDRTYVPVRFVAEGLGFKVTPLYADNGTTASVVFEK